jgi:hypothetical protein
MAPVLNFGDHERARLRRPERAGVWAAEDAGEARAGVAECRDLE